MALISVLEYPPARSPHAGFMTPEKADEYTAFTSINAHISNDTGELTERIDD